VAVNEDLEKTKKPAPPDSPYAALTIREREILQLLAEGMATKEIASHLDKCVCTVQAHLRNIARKLGVCGRARLTKYAVRQGLVSLEDRLPVRIM
jgi:DNA-binding NarL/FixJ family response regulator